MTDIEFEQVVIKTLYANEEVSSKILPELREEWFSHVDHKFIVKSILDYNTQFAALPNIIEMRRLLTDQRTVDEFNRCMDIPDQDVNTPYMLEEIQSFVRKRLLKQVGSQIANYCTTGQTSISFADESAYAESFTFDTKIGFSFFEEPEKIFEGIVTNEQVYPSGCKTLDDMIGGGFHEKSLNLIMSPTNVGKTLIMCSIAASMILAGKSVLYVSFEDSELKIGQRIMQNLFDITQTELRALNKSAYGKLWMKMKNQIGANKLVIKEYSEGCVNALTLKALIKDLKDKRKFIPDVLIVDYIGCMIPNGRMNPNMNDNTRLLNVSAQVRSIGMEMGIPVISASQSNRGGYGKSEIGLDDAADSFGQTMKADAIFGVTQPPELKAANMYNVKLLKTRYGNMRGTTVTIGVNIEKQKIYDLRNTSNVTATSFTPTADAVPIDDPMGEPASDSNDINVFD